MAAVKAARRANLLSEELERLARLEAEVLALEAATGSPGRDTRPCGCKPMPDKNRRCADSCQCWCHRSPDYRGMGAWPPSKSVKARDLLENL